MRLPTLVLGLAALLAVPAVMLAQDAAGKTTTSKHKTAGKAAKGKAKKAVSTPKATPAKLLFGAVKTPAPLASRAIGFYAKGCLAGAEALPIDGPAWQAMRLSRNRNWGHPAMISFLEKFAADVKAHDGWPGLLVGDISQPRGGPMVSSHASHQIGLDADIWYNPMPDRRLSEKEREEISADSMLADDRVSVDPKKWTAAHLEVVKRAASYPQVHFVLVHPAIKKAICDASVNEKDRVWLSKVRPYWGHNDHFHIRLNCPKDSAGCESQAPVNTSNDGCGADLTRWLKLVKPAPRPPVTTPPGGKPPVKPPPPKPPLTLDQMPAACRLVLASGRPEADKPPQAVTKGKAAPPPLKKAAPAPKAAKTAPTKASLGD